MKTFKYYIGYIKKELNILLIIMIMSGISTVIIAFLQRFTPMSCVNIFLWVYASLLFSRYIFDISDEKLNKAILLLSTAVFCLGAFIFNRIYYHLDWHSVIGILLIQIIIITIISKDLLHLYIAQVLSLIYLIASNAVDIHALAFMNQRIISILDFFESGSAFALTEFLLLSWLAVKSKEIVTVAENDNCLVHNHENTEELFTLLEDDETDEDFEEEIINDNKDDRNFEKIALSVSLYINIFLMILLFASRMSLCFGGTFALIILTVSGGLIYFVSEFLWRNEIVNSGLIMLGLFGLMLTYPNFWSDKYVITVTGISGLTFWPVCTAIILSVIMFLAIFLDHIVIGVMFYSFLFSRYLSEYLLNYMPITLILILVGVIISISGVLCGYLKRKFI